MKVSLIPKKLIRSLHPLYLIVDSLYFPGRLYGTGADLEEVAESIVLQTNRKYGRKTIHDRGFGKARGAEYVHH